LVRYLMQRETRLTTLSWSARAMSSTSARLVRRGARAELSRRQRTHQLGLVGRMRPQPPHIPPRMLPRLRDAEDRRLSLRMQPLLMARRTRVPHRSLHTEGRPGRI